ncbi:hypothetical protein [Teredinibacter haidensis]|uniref:hypothetical protein n=1 Tax=Teredinibacter haidensis TaxID=2731755 RepID=UPI0009491570|nr:hypothetical protein [Teredinibacter haidensis]
MFKIAMNKNIVLFTLILAGSSQAGPYSTIENLKCKPESDVCETRVKILKEGVEVVEISGLEGPIIHSSENSQVLSCESNAVFETKGIKVFGYDGKELFSYPHLGYQRECGVLAEGALYWFLYNIVENDKPQNSVVVLNSKGEVVFRSGITVLTDFGFSYNGVPLTLTVPAPDWPG